MAGSYNHCVDDEGRFIGVRLLDHLGDAYEALEEMYGMIWYLASAYGAPTSVEGQREIVEEARASYREGLERSPGIGETDD